MIKGKVKISTVHYLGKKLDANVFTDYIINGNGELEIFEQLKVNKAIAKTKKDEETADGNLSMPKFGMQMVLPKIFKEIQFYGRGPVENYIDRNYASHVGIYSQSVDKQCFDYIRPQETGNKTDVRWYKIFAKDGLGIKIESDTLMSITARKFLDNDLDEGDKKNQAHTREIKPRDFSVLSIDYKQMGVGGIDSWGEWPLEKYRLPYGNYSFRFKITPIFN